MSYFDAPAPSPAVIAGFSVLTAAVVATVIVAVSTASKLCGDNAATARRRTRRVASALIAWMGFTALAAATGALARFDLVPPPLPVLMLLATFASTAFACSSVGAVLARGLPIAALVGFHAFRIPLEVMLHQLSLDGVVPVQMTWDGMNFDIVSGVTAVAVALWAARGRPPRSVLLLWNLLGVVLLLVIVTVAILSMPTALRVFANDPANTIPATLPFVWLPAILVQAAWVGHVLLFRRLGFDRA